MEQIRAEAAARQYFDLAATMLVVIGANENIIAINKKACEVLGCSEDDAVNSNWFDNFLPDDVREEVRGVFQSLIIGDTEPVECYENTVKKMNSERKLIRWHNNVLRDENGEITATVASGDDVTEERETEALLKASESKFREIYENSPIGIELIVAVTAAAQKDELGEIVEYSGMFRDQTTQKQMEQKLLELQKMESIGRLAGGFAHNFNNLLTAVIGNIDLAAIELDAAGNAAQELRSARDAAIKASELSLQLLRFSQKEAIDLVATDPNYVVENVSSLLEGLVGENHHITTRLDRSLALVMADEKQLGQALINLTLNARDAMPDGGEIEITSSNVQIDEDQAASRPDIVAGDYVRIAIDDQGEGIEADVLPLMFEPFFSTRGVGAGSGLGLNVAYGIIKHHGGWIDVQSTVGKGSRFAIHIPAQFKSKKNNEASQEMDAGARGSVLLVEDEAVVRDMTMKMLARSGFTVYEAANVSEAREQFGLREKEIKVIFCDVVLPDGNGLSLVDELVGRRSGLKALFTSGYSDDMIDEQAVRAKGYLFIQKPYSLEFVKETIAKLMSTGQS